MAEKQYKNYDERFLKEDTPSSEPIEIEAVFSSDKTVLLISEWPDGTPIKTVEDLYSVFKSRAFITFTREIDSRTVEVIASPVSFNKGIIGDQSVASIGFYMGGDTDDISVTTEELYNIVGSGH